MYSLMYGSRMLKSGHIFKECCRCKLKFGYKHRLGAIVLKNHMCTSHFVNRKNNVHPMYLYRPSHLTTVAAHNQRLFCPYYYSILTGPIHVQNSKLFHTSNAIFVSDPKKASSKVEETTEAIKEKAKEKTEKKSDEVVSTQGAKKEVVVVKKSLMQKIKHEVNHYYHGFRLLFIDIRVSSSLVWKVLRGGTLTRREYNLLIRTVGDMFRLVPFSIFIIVPFMELLLPVFIKLFPGMLPSTFQTATEKDDKMKRSLKMKLEMAKFLQQTLDEMAVKGKGHSSQGAKEFIEFFQKVRTEGGGLASNEEILKFSKLFEDEITLDSLTRSQLMALCRVLELQPFGTTNFLRFQLRMKLRSLAADDLKIKKEGVESLTQTELQAACRARGMRAIGMSEQRLRAQLKQWLDLSLNEKVPPSLLLLSRAFMLPETTTTTEKLVATISALPDTVATKAKAAIGEREGKVDNKTKIELIKEEVAKIKEEKKEEEEATVVVPPEKPGELLVDQAPILKDTATVLVDKPKEDKDLSSKDIEETLEDVLDTVGKDKKKMIIEKEELDDLKEEMKDYQEDIQNLNEVALLAKASDEKVDVKESKAAKRLSRSVNKMIMKMDAALEELEKKELTKKENLQKEDSQTPSDELLRVDELILAIRKMQKVPDSSRLETIIKVLGKIDADKDGVVKVDDLLKVLEMIGRENIKLSEKQMDDIIELLKKEEEVEDKMNKEAVAPEKKEDLPSKSNTVDAIKENLNIESNKSASFSKNGTSTKVDTNKHSLPIPPSEELPSPSIIKPPSPSASVQEKKANGPARESFKKM